MRFLTYLIFGYSVVLLSLAEKDFTYLIPQINISIHPRLSKPELIPENGNGRNSSNVPMPAITSGAAVTHHFDTGIIFLIISAAHAIDDITSKATNIRPNGSTSVRNIFVHASVAC